MQTFLPYPDFAESAHVLDNDRLGNQMYRECYTLIEGGWPRSPVSRMWRDHHGILAEYALALCEELARRGRYYPEWIGFYKVHQRLNETDPMPIWWGDERIHSSHRSCLLAKDFDWYSQFGWSERPTPADSKGKWPYVWPEEIGY